ncbi:hypothetical protein K469DRAFT_748137 [Zopfia rhizophila CBS 207.26]|uniref:Nephrocystin 3-like N-terminal domain-containing protein n=1 Tax=Zopfia rhizophila CBS 207.26 TaxID=1314779 RepID=A0A6A6EEB3_9PEZI|nr:hypothetical protein K469DRAFT_748137 [Zopfia rhizophila CBS 207.26]
MIDPSSNHNAAAELYEPHTGTWLFRSPQYDQWLTGSTQFFWVHGIPGAGKTVLLSFVVQTIQKYCQSEEPGITSLIPAFSVIAQLFNTVYLLVDALDETQDQTKLVSTLKRLTDLKFGTVKILATSRREADIDALLCETPHISLSNPLVDEDIRLYIREMLSKDYRFAEWPKSLSREVEAALVGGAKGISVKRFHIDLLRSAKNLDETYERILVSISDRSRPYAQRALQWLSEPVNESRLTPDVLAVAITMPCQDGEPTPREKLLSLTRLHNICACLITVVDLNYLIPRLTPRLAHYTVKEFLFSDRIKNTQACSFFASSRSASLIFANTLVKFLLSFDATLVRGHDSPFSSPATSSDSENEMVGLQGFYGYAIHSWYECAKRVDDQGGDDEIYDLIFKLLDPDRDGFEIFRTRTIISHEDAVLPDWLIDEENWSSAVLAYLCKLGLLGVAKTWLERHPSLAVNQFHLEPGPTFFELYCAFDSKSEGSPLHIAAANGEQDLVRHFILDDRVDYAARSSDYLCPLGIIIISDMPKDIICEFLQMMIKNGADINPCRVSRTPLELAVMDDTGNFSVVKLLVDYGVDVNAIGDADPGDDFIYGGPDDYSTPLESVESRLLVRRRYSKSEEGLERVVELLKSHGATIGEIINELS